MKYKAALGVAYGAGLRVSQVAHLKTARTLQSLWNDHPTKYGAPEEGRTRTVIISYKSILNSSCASYTFRFEPICYKPLIVGELPESPFLSATN